MLRGIGAGVASLALLGCVADIVDPGGDDDGADSDGGGGGGGDSDAAPPGTPDAAPPAIDATPVEPPPYLPLYRIELRVHIGQSGLALDEFAPILEEVNLIWRSQAGVCFEIHTVDDDETMSTGFDFWYAPDVGGPNGYYAGDHDIWTKDHPSLGAAPNPVEHPQARTTAHELGHGLTLDHRQDSDDNLMRSGTLGWQLNEAEIDAARGRAEEKALDDLTPLVCGPPQIGGATARRTAPARAMPAGAIE